MKKIFSILILFSTLSIWAQTPQQLMQQGNDAYAKGDFNAAAEAYNAILEGGNESADLYYNLGNTYYRQQEFGLSILNYERALRIKPNFKDARQNLELANSKTEDEITALPQLFLVTWAKGLVSACSPTAWCIILLILFNLIGGCIVIVILSNDYNIRKSALIAAIVLGVISLIAIACTIDAHIQYKRHNTAIITQPMIVVKSSPEAKSVDKLILHEGTKVSIDENLGEWNKIHIADGNTGWVAAEDITII